MVNKLFPSYSPRVAIALLLLRVCAGAFFVNHGWGKIQNPLHWMGPDAATPAFFQLLAAVSEFAGGAALVLGLLTPLACFGIACTMAVAAYTHLSSGKGSPELAVVYLSIALLYGAAGPGQLSLDWLWTKRWRTA